MASCRPISTNIADDRTPRSSAISTPTLEPIQAAPANSSDMVTIRKYAESYEPRSGREVIPSPPVPNDRILKIISDLASAKSREHEKYIILIFLRLWRFQVEHFKQSYELGRSNPLTKEFYRPIGRVDYEKAEFLPAYLADNYVEKHSELLEYPLIAVEIARIAKAAEKIKKELDNTTKKQAAKNRSNWILLCFHTQFAS